MNRKHIDKKITNIPWYQGKFTSLISEVLLDIFSLGFLKALFSSFAYYLHEHVTWRRVLKQQGKYNRIHSRASIRNAHNIIMGNNVRITMDCCIWAGEDAKIIMGNDILIGPGSKIFCGNHGTKNNGIAMTYQDRVEKDVIIEDDIWIGANCIITSGVKICKGAVVAAGSVVTKNVDENTVVGGVPAKVIKLRD